jgi:DNA-binding response OmpR family regulator
MLGSRDYVAVFSNRPKQTLHNILHNDIDLVMLDHFIAGVNGVEVCRELKENENTAGTPILMISGNTTVKKDCLTA